MALSYRKPSEALADELAEVATAARDLLTTINERANVSLPIEFPKDQLSAICESLIQLPHGTAEGCKAALDYARERLPGIRREYIRIDTKASSQDAVTLTRGTRLDVKLGVLISAVSTAWDEYKRAAAEDDEPELSPEVGVPVEASTVQQAVSQGRTLDQAVANAQFEVKAVSTPESERADELTRQFEDVRGLSRMGVAEMRMPKAFGGLLRKTTSALKSYPRVIRNTVDKVQRGVDIAHLLWKRWHEFHSNGVEFVFSEIEKTIAIIEPAIQIMEGNSKSDEQVEFSSVIDASLFVLRRNGGAMTAKNIYSELENMPSARQLISKFPKKKPYGRVLTALMKRRDRVGDVFDVGYGFWSASISKNETTRLRKARSTAHRSLGRPSHSEKTKMGLEKARSNGSQIGRQRSLSDADVDDIIMFLSSRQEDRSAVTTMAKKYKVSRPTVRERVFERTGKRMWPKGPHGV